MSIDLGDSVTLSYTNLAAGLPASAGAMTLSVTLPDGTAATISNPVVPAAAGVYSYDFLTTMAGRHLVRWVGTGANPGAYTDQFDVRPAAPAYIVSLADAKAHLNMSASSTVDDEELRGWIEACTDVVEEVAGMVVARRSISERRFFPHGSRQIALHSIPAISLTSIVDLNGFLTWSVSDFNLDGETGIVDVLWSGGSRPLYGLVEITYLAGMQIVPSRYSKAALMILRHLWATQRAGLGTSTVHPTRIGGPVEDTVVVAGYAIPSAAAELIGSALPGIA